MALQHLRSSTAHKRPIPTVMSAGQIAINTNEASPALFFKDSNGDLVKVGPVHIGTDAPNSSPASVAATALVTGTVYQILTVGTTDFTLVGASANTVGVVFTATGATTGTGTVSGQQGVEKGEMWLDTTGGTYVLKIYDGSAWRSESGTFVDVSGDTMTGDLVFNNADIVFEGATADDFETTLTVTDPTADRTITLPDVTGTVVTTGDTGSVTSTMILDGTIVNADVNASAAIAGTKINPDFGSQNVVTTGTNTAASFIPTSSTVPTNGVYLPSANNVALATNGAGRLFVDSSGDVGIGTSSPDYKLHVNQSISSGFERVAELAHGADSNFKLVTANGSSTNSPGEVVSRFGIYYEGTGWDTYINYIRGSLQQVGSIAFSTADAERMRIDSTGKVGIGTSSPGSALEIDAAASTSPFIAKINTSEAARIDSSGRLLVGTSTSIATSIGGITYGLIREQLAGTDGNGAVKLIAQYSAAFSFCPTIALAKSQNGTLLNHTALVSGCKVGRITAAGSDGTKFVEGGSIEFVADSGFAADSAPTRLVFSSTPSGSATPVERMRIDNAGRVGFNFPTLGGGSGQYRFAGSITGAASSSGLLYTPTIQPDVTTSVAIFSSQVSTAANGGTPYTVANVINYFASQTAFNADSTVTNQIGYNASSNLTGAANNFGFYSAIPDAANRWNFYATGTAPNYFAGKIASLGSYNDTTASAANVFIASNGDIQRSTSSIRYKTDIETLEQSYADNVILNARPVWYRSLCEADNAGWSYYGLIAEEVAELDPRLVFWGRPTKEVLQEEAKDAVVDDEGNIIEPATEAVYTNIEDTDAELRPEGVQYDRLTVMLIDVVQRQQKAIEALEAKVAALEAR